MTSHLDEGRLQELIDGEIPSSELAPVQAHLAVCAECRARLDEARDFAEEAQVLIETIELTERPVSEPQRVPKTRPNPLIRNLAWAATVVIAAGAGYMARGTDRSVLAREASPSAPPSETAQAATMPVEAASPESDRLSDPESRPENRPAPRRERDAASDPRSTDPGKEKKLAAVEPRGKTTIATEQTADSGAAKARQSLDEVGARKNEAIAMATAPESPRAAAPPPVTRGASAPMVAQGGIASQSSANRFDAAAARVRAAPVEITFPDALNHLNGRLRLIEGMVPLRLELMGPEVRVVYPLATGELVLSQHLEDGKLVFHLTAPEGFPADSLERLKARVRD